MNSEDDPPPSALETYMAAVNFCRGVILTWVKALGLPEETFLRDVHLGVDEEAPMCCSNLILHTCQEPAEAMSTKESCAASETPSGVTDYAVSSVDHDILPIPHGYLPSMYPPKSAAKPASPFPSRYLGQPRQVHFPRPFHSSSSSHQSPFHTANFKPPEPSLSAPPHFVHPLILPPPMDHINARDSMTTAPNPHPPFFRHPHGSYSNSSLSLTPSMGSCDPSPSIPWGPAAQESGGLYRGGSGGHFRLPSAEPIIPQRLRFQQHNRSSPISLHFSSMNRQHRQQHQPTDESLDDTESSGQLTVEDVARIHFEGISASELEQCSYHPPPQGGAKVAAAVHDSVVLPGASHEERRTEMETSDDPHSNNAEELPVTMPRDKSDEYTTTDTPTDPDSLEVEEGEICDGHQQPRQPSSGSSSSGEDVGDSDDLSEEESVAVAPDSHEADSGVKTGDGSFSKVPSD